MMTISVDDVVATQPGWYRGDFHAHTNYSDGRLSPEELLTEARQEKLHFFSMTDHNNTYSHEKFPPHEDMLILPGIEVTLAYGHFNVFGLADGPEPEWMNSLPKTFEDYEAHMESGRTQYTSTQLMEITAASGLYNSINHPLLHPWAWLDHETDLRHVHFLEIWNDPSWPDNDQMNPAAVEMWTRWLNDGHRHTAIGGSDFHTPFPSETPDGHPVGRHHLSKPTTYVYAEALSGRAILDGLLQRHAYMTMEPEITFTASADNKTYIIGDEITTANGRVAFQSTVTGNGRLTLQLISNGDILIQSTREDSVSLEYETPILSNAWFRIDVRNTDNQLIAVTNPIFYRPPQTPRSFRYGDYLL